MLGLDATYLRNRSELEGRSEATNSRTMLGAHAGFGLEWFPMESLSIGGHVGLSAGYQRQDASAHPAGFADRDRTRHGGFLRTGPSGIRLHLYF